MSAKVWITSDWHINHVNIIDFCNRPFKSVEEMNNDILYNLNSVVRKDDILYNLGDVGFFKNKDQSKNWLSKIKCQNHFVILGNHDRFKQAQCQDYGIRWASRNPIIIDGFWILSHERLFLNGNCQPYINLHGHEHNATPLYGPYSANVSIENTNYFPIALTDLQEYFRKNWRSPIIEKYKLTNK